MALEIEIKSNSKQAEASLKNLLKTIDQIPASVQKGNAEMASFSKDVSKDLKTLNKNVEQSSKSINQTVKSMANFAKITSGIITGLLAAGGISSLSSSFTELNNRIALTTGRTKQLVVQQQKLFAISRRSNVDLQTTVDLYSSLVVNAQRSRAEATQLTEVLIKAGKVGGGSADTIASSLIQLQQGLASGTLRGEELNSVLEGTPRIAQAIAKELGVGIGQLRSLAAEGRISSEVVASALLNAKDEIEAEFATLEIPFNQIIANSGREIGIGLNRLFGAINGTFKTVFGGGDLVGTITDAVVNALLDLSVFIRRIQTEIVLLKLEFGSLGNFVEKAFSDMVSGVVSYANKFTSAVDSVKDFARDIGNIFYDLYIEVVGNSTWPDLIDGVIRYAKKLPEALYWVGQFVLNVAKMFADLGAALLASAFTSFFGGLNAMALIFIGVAKVFHDAFDLLSRALYGISPVFLVVSYPLSLLSDLMEELSKAALALTVVLTTLTGIGFARVSFSLIEVANHFRMASFSIKKFKSSFERSLSEKLADKLDSLADKIGNFGERVKSIFYDIYKDVVGNSTWPDLVDGVIDYADRFNKAYDKVADFTSRVSAVFRALGFYIKHALVLPALSGMDSMLSNLKRNVFAFINQVSAYALEGITTGLGAALVGAFALAIAGGGFAGGIGAKIATAFIGAVGAYLLGFAGNFNSGEAGENGVMAQIAMNTENTYLTIADGVGRILRLLAQVVDGVTGDSALGDIVSGAIGLFADNVGAFVLALPILIGTIKALGGAGNAAASVLGGGLIRGVGQALGDEGQISGSAGRISKLRAQEDRLKADIESIGATFKGGAKELEAEKDKLTASLRNVSEEIKRNESVLTEARSRRNQRRDNFIRGAGNLAGGVGGILGGFGGAALGESIGRSFGLTSGQTLIATLIGSQLIGVLGAGIAQFFVQRAVSAFLVAGTKVSVLLRSAMIQGGAVVRAAILAAYNIGAVISRAAIIAGNVAAAAIVRGAIIAGNLAAAAIMSGIAFLIANAIPIAIGLGVAALIGAAYTFRDEIVEGAKLLIEKAKEGFEFLKDLGSDFADAALDGFERIKDFGKDMATSFFEMLKGLNPLSLFGFEGQDPVKRANGGSVFGAGSSTSDSIPAMLSNGEFVVKTSVANKHRGLLEYLNSTGKLPGFNTGGSVGSGGGSGGGFMSTINSLFESMIEMLREFVGEENIAKFSSMLDGLKSFFGFGGGNKQQSNEILDTKQLASAVAEAIGSRSEATQEQLISAFNTDAKLTSRVLSLNEQRTKLQQKIADIESRNETVPLELLTQLKIIDNDIVAETGRVGDILEEIKESGERQIKAIDDLATSTLNNFKSETEGGIAGLLKGEIGLEEFGKGILDSFTGNVLDSVAGGITEGIFNTETGESSGIGTMLEGLFGDLGMMGFGIGETVGGGLGELGTMANPMFVKLADSLGLGGGVDEFGIGPGADIGMSDKEFDDLGIGGLGEMGELGDTEEANEGFLSGIKGVFNNFLPGISGIFDGLTGSLGGIFDGLLGSLGGLFGGGGGGGGIGGLLSLAGGFFNDGGMVPGGGPTPVIAHGGEMILNKRQQGHLFNQLDKNRNGGGGQVVQNLTITGDISRQTKREILGMMPQIAAGVNQNNLEQNR